ncbi:gas vesicle protein GvpO [Kribbella sp. NPDC054772]
MATPRKTSPPRRTAANGSERSTTDKAPRASQDRKRTGRHSLRTVAVSAAAELAQLSGQVPEGIVAVEKRDDGWCVQVEVVESHRIPETTDILAVYEVNVDDGGQVVSYRRMNRYVRGRIED